MDHACICRGGGVADGVPGINNVIIGAVLALCPRCAKNTPKVALDSPLPNAQQTCQEDRGTPRCFFACHVLCHSIRIVCPPLREPFARSPIGPNQQSLPACPRLSLSRASARRGRPVWPMLYLMPATNKIAQKIKSHGTKSHRMRGTRVWVLGSRSQICILFPIAKLKSTNNGCWLDLKRWQLISR